ncbi:MAG: hypothetical protein ACO32I_07220 [Candidatus Limnocylindrus sp.]
MGPEDFARNLAHVHAIEKLASLPPWLKNPATIGGAGLGAAYGAYAGGSNSREGDRAYGSVMGGLAGAISGGAAGYGVRTLVKTVPEGSKQISAAKTALEKELAAKGIAKPPANANAEAVRKYKDEVKDYLESVREKMQKATTLATEGKHGQDAMNAVDSVRKNFGAVGELKSGREKFYGGLVGGGLGVGYGAYTLAGTKNLNAPTPEERQLSKTAGADPAVYTAVHLGQLLAHF